jgi:hypothetical protein
LNGIIAAVAGGLLGAVTMLGTVNAIEPTATAVSPDDLYTYADE